MSPPPDTTGQHHAANEVPFTTIGATLERIERKLDSLSNGHGDLHTRVAVLEASNASLRELVSGHSERIRKLEDTRAQLVLLAALVAAAGSWLLSHIH